LYEQTLVRLLQRFVVQTGEREKKTVWEQTTTDLLFSAVAKKVKEEELFSQTQTGSTS